MSTQNAVITEVNTTVQHPNFGTGRYSPLMEEVYKDSMIVFKLESAKAEKLARQIASDLGAIMANAPVEVKLSKMNKDGKLNIMEAAKIKGITVTNAIFALRALNYAAEAGKHGFIFAQTGWKMGNGLVEYFNTL